MKWLLLIQALTLSVIAISVVRGGHVIPAFFELRKSKMNLSRAVDELHNKNANISVEIDKLRNSSDYAKKVLRDKYHVVEADESMQLFTD
jgi:cell division protein FtsB